MDIKSGSEKPITINDLALPFLKQADTDSGSTLKRRLVALSQHDTLTSTEQKKEKKTASGIKKKAKTTRSNIIATPLPRVTQDQIQRKAAYSETSRDIGKWLPAVMENRKADHLSFPLGFASNTATVSNRTLAAKFEPTTALEQDIERILKEGGGSQLKSTLEPDNFLAQGSQSIEEMKKKQIELQKMRSFLFFQEKKLKQWAKIKSKSYHRVNKREKLRARQTIEDEAIQMRERMKREMERAKERMTLRHRGSQRQLYSGVSETEKQIIVDDLKRVEALKKKVALDSSDSEIQSEEDEDEASRNEAPDATAAKHNKSSLFTMKFMQREKAVAEKKPDTEDDGEDSAGSGSGHDSEDEDKDDNAKSRGKNKANSQSGPASDDEQEPVGRKSFKRLAHQPDQAQAKAPEPSIANQLCLPLSSSLFTETDSHDIVARDEQGSIAELNPWSELNASSFSIPKKRDPKRPKEILEASAPLIGISEDTAEALVLKDDAHIQFQFQFQRDLIQQAFANDDVFREFEDEKAKIIEEDAPKDKDVTLPGWGSWGGAGIDTSRAKRVIEKAKPGEGVQPSQRKDIQLNHVIINERRIKSIDKYQLDKVPYPFENKLQYEASQRMPIGKEWNALSVHQKQTLPRVQTRPGTIIEPLKHAKKST